MTAAIFTLVGVIVGGLLSGVVQLLLHRRAESRVRLVAARLVLSELTWIASAIQAHLNGGAPEFRTLLSRESLEGIWAEHRAILANELGDAAWNNVARAVWQSRLRLIAEDEPKTRSLEVWLDSVHEAMADLSLLALHRLAEKNEREKREARDAIRQRLQTDAEAAFAEREKRSKSRPSDEAQSTPDPESD